MCPTKWRLVELPFVYILRCSDDTLYTGYTVDIDRRLEIHQEGLASKYTRGRRPVQLVYLEELDSKGEALRREIIIKKMNRPQKLVLISEYLAIS
jgi:putative endonuclease